MIAGVHGRIVSKAGDRIVLATAGGVSYEIAVPLGVLERLPNEGDVTLATVLVVREDGWALYGFDDDAERMIFQRLLAATGVGPRLALALVSTLGGARVARSVVEGDVAALCTVPGVGKKTAERMVLELRDAATELAQASGTEPAPVLSRVDQDVTAALVNLGYKPIPAERAVAAATSENPDAEFQEILRSALRQLARI
jgi:Holliday junction DNA helicase RuvA